MDEFYSNCDYFSTTLCDVRRLREEDFNAAQEYVEGIQECLYITGDEEKLKEYLEELCCYLECEFINPTQIKTKKRNATMQDTEQQLLEIQNTNKMCRALLESPHYKKIGAEGVFAIVEKAKSIGVSPIDALNGGMYFVRGKVEMSANMMNQLIRQHKHSVKQDEKTIGSEKICILHGKRADNGDTWIESFSIEEAERARLTSNPTWKMYPRDMLFARALSRLARQLFPDVIKGCYVQGEIAHDLSILEEVPSKEVKETTISELPNEIDDAEFKELDSYLGDNYELRSNIRSFLKKKFGISDLRKIPREFYSLALSRAKEQSLQRAQALGEEQQMEVS